MMKRNNKKRGFTIIELTIVVAVIAILSAVLIPTFAGIIRKSRLTADEQAVRSINLELVAADEEDLANLEKVEAYLADLGLTIEDYKPVSKNYKLAYSAALKKVLLLDAENKVVYPAEYVNQTITVEYAANNEITELQSQDDIALVATSRGGEVTISNDLAIDTAMYLTKNTTIELNADISAPNDTVGDGVFCAKKGTLTLNGNGTVNGVGDNDYNIAVWADGGEVIINGGTYTNVGARDDDCNLIYVKNGGKVIINGGTFIAEDPQWTLNSHDSKTGTFVVKGGEFFEFDPSNVTTEPAASGITSWVAEGYTVETEVRTDGTWYKVVKA